MTLSKIGSALILLALTAATFSHSAVAAEVSPLIVAPTCNCPQNAEDRFDCTGSPSSCDANGGRDECQRCNTIGRYLLLVAAALSQNR